MTDSDKECVIQVRNRESKLITTGLAFHWSPRSSGWAGGAGLGGTDPWTSEDQNVVNVAWNKQDMWLLPKGREDERRPLLPFFKYIKQTHSFIYSFNAPCEEPLSLGSGAAPTSPVRSLTYHVLFLSAKPGISPFSEEPSCPSAQLCCHRSSPWLCPRKTTPLTPLPLLLREHSSPVVSLPTFEMRVEKFCPLSQIFASNENDATYRNL